jgi:hypothetical protein
MEFMICAMQEEEGDGGGDRELVELYIIRQNYVVLFM